MVINPYRFESMWVGNAECFQIIKDSWCSHNEYVLRQNIMDCIQRCGKWLRIWNRTNFDHVQRNFRKAQAQFESLKGLEPSLPISNHHTAWKEVQKWLEKEEIMWC